MCNLQDFDQWGWYIIPNKSKISTILTEAVINIGISEVAFMNLKLCAYKINCDRQCEIGTTQMLVPNRVAHSFTDLNVCCNADLPSVS